MGRTAKVDLETEWQPTELKLPDGRVFQISEILKQVGPSTLFNLRSREPVDNIRNFRWTIEDRRFCATASLDDIVTKFKIKRNYACALRTRSQQILAELE